LLLTNDGELAQLLMHPSSQVKKTYRATVLGDVLDASLERLRRGVTLEDGRTAPAEVSMVEYLRTGSITVFDITIHEGRNRQVRRMCDAIGHPVRSLLRSTFAGLLLEGMRRGQIRELSEREVAELYSLGRQHEQV
jgi:23S rRNA pseudouridine2605 synthase